MNKKTFVSMLSLVITFLFSLYVLKLFFPQEFVLCIQLEGLVRLGNFIDTHAVLKFFIGFLIGFIFDYFYFGAVCKQLRLNWKLLIIIIVYGLALNAYYAFAPVEVIIEYTMLVVIASSLYMILIPMFFTKTIKELSITYTINSVSQLLMLFIRDIAIETANTNTLTTFMLSLDNYLWIALCFIIFNYRRNANGKS